MSAKSVLASIVGGAIGLVLAIVWLIVLDVATREVGKGLEAVLGEQGLLVASGVVLIVIGSVLLVAMLGDRPGPDRGRGRWLLWLAGSVLTVAAGVAAIATAF
jgi:hypothetical protein